MHESVYVDVGGLLYRKSSASAEGGIRCVGVRRNAGTVAVVNTKAQQSVIEFSLSEWEAFLVGVKNGEFDLSNLK